MKQYTLVILTEDKAGLLNRLTVILNRRKINIDSITCSETEVKGIFRFTILIQVTAEMAQKVTKQMEKQIEVIRAYYFEAEEVIYQEIALFKMPIEAMQNAKELESLMRANHARILTVEPSFVVIEKTGHDYEIQSLLQSLLPYGVLEFVRSGRVALTRYSGKFTDQFNFVETEQQQLLEV